MCRGDESDTMRLTCRFEWVTFWMSANHTCMQFHEDFLLGAPGALDHPAVTRPKFAYRLLRCCLFCLLLLLVPHAVAATPDVGAVAPEFTLMTPAGATVHLQDELHKGTVVLVLLRGFPGYQCPYCTRQVHDFVEHAAAFAADKAEVLLVYPGPPADLDQHAKDFLAQQAALPQNVVLVTDPDYKMTDTYGLRWDAPHETAYPSTFILDQDGKVRYEKISHSHGDRISAENILHQLASSSRSGAYDFTMEL